nr:PREDICTED: MACPF domain-containing protein At1g14780-like isoform X2 [Musa acuminata subsp. malaccensis]
MTVFGGGRLVGGRREEEMSGVVERALTCLGRGFDVSCDFRPEYCRGKERLVVINEDEKRELAVPGFGLCKDVSVDVKCDKGDRVRYQSDVLEFNQMSELFNHRSSLAGKIPSGLFNYAFAFDGSTWAQDASNTKFLAMDGYFITLFELRIEHQPLALVDHVVKAVPSTWDPCAIARFIENYGTHIIVGLSVGGQDVVYVKQDQSSSLPPSELKQQLDKLGDQLFTGSCALPPFYWKSKEHKLKVPEAFNVFDLHKNGVKGVAPVVCKDGVTVMCCKRGGDTSASSHGEWLLTVSSVPDIINFTFLPITSLLKGVPGYGFLSHAINLYIRYKPPLSDLHYFLDFQSHKFWAPMHNDLPLGPISNRSMPTPALTFSHMSPKLYVNTYQVTVGRRPVTGMRLHLEGKKNDRSPRTPVTHACIPRSTARSGAAVAGNGRDRRRAVLRAGPAEEVRAGVHCAGEVRPPVGDRWPRSDRVRRHRSSACRGGPRVHQRAAPQAAVLRGARFRRRPVAVAAGPVLPFSEAGLLLVGERLAVRRLGQGKAAWPGSRGGLSCVSVGPTGASGEAKAAQVCGHLSPVPGPSAQPWPLAGDGCEAGRGEGED